MLKVPVCLCLIMAMHAANGADVIAYADESPPYQFMKNGKATGFATELLMAGCERARLSCEVRIVPWARAYAQAAAMPNTVLFSIVRRPDRERDFIWLSPVMTESVWAFGRIDSPSVSAVSQLKTRRVGVVNGGSAAKFLRDAGIPDSAMDKANSIEANLRKLGARRIDYVIDTEIGLEAEKAKFNIPFDTAKVLKLYDITTYFAMNSRSAPAVVNALRDALTANSASEVRGRLVQEYIHAGAPENEPGQGRK